MSFRTQLFRKVTIVGVGLIGGSIGMAIKKYNLAREVVGYSQRNASLMSALKNHAVDHTSLDLKKAVYNADLVILSTPVSTIINILTTIGPFLKHNCIITDVGSTKTTIFQAAEKSLSNPSFFVGSHPLTGSEKTGSSFADPNLFENALCIMTPTNKTNNMARDKVKQLWSRMGARVKFLSAEEHDAVLAYISHLPHIIAYALMETIPNEYLEYAAQGLKDTTRIASSSPQMWKDICFANSGKIIKSLDELIANFSKVRKSIVTEEQQNLFEIFKKAKMKRDGLEPHAP